MPIRICIDPGHGGSDPGASFCGLDEKKIVLEVSLSLSEEVDKFGLYPVLTRSGDEFISLAQRCKIANTHGCQAFVSIHCNADADPDEPGMLEAFGEEIWYHPRSPESFRLATAFKDSVDYMFPEEKFRGLKASDKLYVLRSTVMPAILVEMGFIDKRETNDALDKPETIVRLANCLLLGVLKYFPGEGSKQA